MIFFIEGAIVLIAILLYVIREIRRGREKDKEILDNYVHRVMNIEEDEE